MGIKKRWRCSTHVSRGCKALCYTVQGAVIAVNGCHNHKPKAESLEYIVIPSGRGRGILILFNGYTYASRGSLYTAYCSKRDTGCQARIKFSRDGQKRILLYESRIYCHDHPPPDYIVTKNGEYVKA
ncbi:unnamed protein product [Leptosia nina]|uniref:Modifier of mdg4 n=1 Tax=Leptosia nina TaxID=320188 RepID=A0AAV1J634_9NEOP